MLKEIVRKIEQTFHIKPYTPSQSELELFEVKKIKVQDISMNYAKAGKGPPVILVHGLTNNWYGLIPLAKELMDSYTLYIPDIPGFGDSGKLRKYTLETISEHVISFVKQLGLRSADIGGLSFGSYVISQILDKYPNSFRRCVLMSPVFVTERNRHLYNITHVLFAYSKKTGPLMQELYKYTASSRLGFYIRAKYLNMYKYDRLLAESYGKTGADKMSPKAYVEIGYSISKTHTEKLLENYKKPLLIIYGQHDKITSLKDAKKILSKYSGNRFTYALIPESGHCVSLEQPQATAKAIKKFLTREDPN